MATPITACYADNPMNSSNPTRRTACGDPIRAQPRRQRRPPRGGGPSQGVPGHILTDTGLRRRCHNEPRRRRPRTRHRRRNVQLTWPRSWTGMTSAAQTIAPHGKRRPASQASFLSPKSSETRPDPPCGGLRCSTPAANHGIHDPLCLIEVRRRIRSRSNRETDPVRGMLLHPSDIAA